MRASTVISTTNCSSSGAGQNGYLFPFCREDAGAKLPINYSLSSLPSDANNGSNGSPVRTLSKGISLAQNGE